MQLGSIFGVLLCFGVTAGWANDTRWRMHVIDNSSRGADGVKLADINADGRPDICTGWEEGGEVRVYLHPGSDRLRQSWPRVTVGQVSSPEDAVFADLDGDGAVDVISSCEGGNQSVNVHWSPPDKQALLDSRRWKTAPFPALKNRSRWMFCLPVQVDGRNGIDLVVGSKAPHGQVGWLRAPANPRDLAAWEYEKICDAGWIMSIRAFDLDDDGQPEIVFSDRKSTSRGIYVLGKSVRKDQVSWKIRQLSNRPQEFMFLDLARPPHRQEVQLVTATRNGFSLAYSVSPGSFTARDPAIRIGNPFQIDTGKAVAIGDLDLDGKLDLVFSANTATINHDGPGLCFLSDYAGQHRSGKWQVIGPAGRHKYDRIELVDLDGDGDLDVVTCEERAGLGVIWFENPFLPTDPRKEPEQVPNPVPHG